MRHHIGQTEIIVQEIQRCNIQIATLSELHLTGSGTTNVKPSSTNKLMTFYYSGRDKWEAHVGIMVDRRISTSVFTFQPISERLAILTIDGTTTTHIVSAYVPTEAGLDAATDKFYNCLQLVLDTTPKTDLIIIAGDLNSHTGSKRLGIGGHPGVFQPWRDQRQWTSSSVLCCNQQ